MAGATTARDYLGLAVKIARDGAQMLADRVEARSVRSAEGRDIKIEADYLLDRFILDRIAAEAPLPVLSEESGGALHDGDCWIVDPLDGSFNFARGLPFCCISIALWRGRLPLLGVVHDFQRNECFSAIVGEGAWLNGQAMRPSGVTDRRQAVLSTGIPIRNTFGPEAATQFIDRVRAFKKTRLLGSAALMLAYVACGRMDVYREEGIALWDVAAGLALVQASGGHVEWRQGSDGRTLDVEASNSHLS